MAQAFIYKMLSQEPPNWLTACSSPHAHIYAHTYSYVCIYMLYAPYMKHQRSSWNVTFWLALGLRHGLNWNPAHCSPTYLYLAPALALAHVPAPHWRLAITRAFFSPIAATYIRVYIYIYMYKLWRQTVRFSPANHASNKPPPPRQKPFSNFAAFCHPRVT